VIQVTEIYNEMRHDKGVYDFTCLCECHMRYQRKHNMDHINVLVGIVEKVPDVGVITGCVYYI
jgi:hypothetical protein